MNPRRSASFVTLLLLVGLLLPTLAMGSATPIADGASTHVVRVPAEAAPMFNRLGLSPRQALDYNTFHWFELNEADFAALSASGVPFTLVPEAGIVRVLDFVFDPLAGGEPSLPVDMQAEGEGPGFRLVQLVGPVKDDWLAQLKAAGLPPLQYYPHNTYLTWTTATQSESAESLAFVRWQGAFHPAYKISEDLRERSGRIRNVDVLFYNDGDVQATLDAIIRLGGDILLHYPAQPDEAFFDAIVQLDASGLADVARLGTVLWLGYASPEPVLDDEMSTQIAAGNYAAGVPFTGYFSWLANLGYDGSGVIWSITDTGVDYDHPDLTSRIVGGYTYAGCPAGDGPGDDPLTGGHGTHVAGIVGGDASGGFADLSGFLYGLGVAPGYSIFAQNPICGSGVSWPPTGGWQELSKQGVLGNAVGANNSWTSGEGTAHGYQATERTHDFMVRDGNFDTAGVAEPYILVFSAGNSGPGSTTLTAPKEAKNLIVTAGTQNYRVSSNIDAMYNFSSRGPAVDGRYVPTLAAPGQQIASTRNDLGGNCATSIPGTSDLYAYCSGTSMAAPHTSGSVALITEWWRDSNAGADPSPAMAKALLINGAVDISGAPPIPNFDEGWGRINLGNVVDNGTHMVYRDQSNVLANSGDSWTLTVSIPDPTKPFKVSVVWTDAPGAVGANPALVNNLDLVVSHGSDTYYGNQFSSGWSTSGGSPDTLNNLENVYIQNPGGTATITVQATNIAGDGVPYNGDITDQDFAFVCHNCTLQADFALNAEPATLDVCVPDDAVYDVTLDSLQSFDDAVTLHTSGEPAGTTTQFSVNPVIPPGTSVLTVTDTASATPGSYAMDIVGVAPTTTHTTTVGLNLYDAVPGAVTLLSPADGAMGVASTPRFDWIDSSQGATYDLQVSTDPTFSTFDVGVSGISTSTFTLTAPLDLATCYFWRAAGENACGVSGWAEPSRFATLALDVSFSDDMESGDGQWSHEAAQGTDGWQISTAQSHSPTQAWFVPDDPTITDSYLWNTTPVLVGSGSTLSFWHRYQFEGDAWDGSVLEISTNGGGSWQDLGPHITANGYNGTIGSGYGNPLGDRQAWTGDLTTWTEVTVDLSSFAGQSVQVRWRLGCDVNVSDVGWYIDDVVITVPLPPSASPTLLSITPNAGSPAVDTPVQIGGSGFVDLPNVKLGDTWLLTVTWVSSTTLDAVVPAGMALGVYDLTLYNGGDCQAATLADAYTVGECVSPTVSLASDSPVELGQPMLFTATASGTAPFTYTWDVGGLGTGSGLDTATPVFTYTEAGSYTAAVTVENACGFDTASQVVEVVCTEPGVELASDSPVELGQPMVFTATASGTAPFTYTWGFGGPGTGSGLDTATPVFTYTEAGSYTAAVTVENACGFDSASQAVEVVCTEPGVELASDSPVELGQRMMFTATATGTAPFTYTWGFGGPGTGSGLDTATPVFTYTEAGSYTAAVTVENPCGLDTAAATAMVLEPTLVLTKTVGTDATNCAATSLITVTMGTEVIYCYEVLNTSETTYTLHSLADSHLGTIFAGASYTLAPGASYWVTASANITQTTVNTAVWTAYWDAGLSARATARAKVVVEAPAHLLYLPIIVRSAGP